MKIIKLIMGMPITIEIVDKNVTKQDIEDVFRFFRKVDEQFSPYKKTSEVARINSQETAIKNVSLEMQEILTLAEKAKKDTAGYFDVYAKGYLDPSGVVKSWAIKRAAQMLKERGYKHFFVDAGGDIQVAGYNKYKEDWRVGIRHPFETEKIVKIVKIPGGIATSGTYLRGDHIVTPITNCHPAPLFRGSPLRKLVSESQYTKHDKRIVSLTVIGEDVLSADLYATAAFAMGESGIGLIEKTPGLEGYMIDSQGLATITTGFEQYVV